MAACHTCARPLPALDLADVQSCSLGDIVYSLLMVQSHAAECPQRYLWQRRLVETWYMHGWLRVPEARVMMGELWQKFFMADGLSAPPNPQVLVEVK